MTQETVLGDLLRQFQSHEEDDTLPLDLHQFLPEELRNDPLSKIADITDVDQRHELLMWAAKLGIDLIDVPIEEALEEVS